MPSNTSRMVAYDCRHFLGDRPCLWHKQNGAICECEHYRPHTNSLLVVKLGAMGDVLRTTCVLPIIEKAWPDMRLSWITRRESMPLLENNPYIAEVIPYGTDALVHLSSRMFDRVINLDACKISAGLSTLARAKEKIGYAMHQDGYVTETNAAAGAWLRMGLFDDVKRSNRRTYQEVVCSILGLPTEGVKYILELTECEKRRGKQRFEELGVCVDRAVVGIHTGGGGRWRLKQWKVESFIYLIAELVRELGSDVQIVLFGGPLECEINRRICDEVKSTLVDTGCDNEVRHFAALISYCTVIVSGDSLAMHTALAMGRRVVVLFGPTSHTEVDLFGLGEKVIPDLACVGCYKEECDFVPNCMSSISVDMVKGAVLRQLAAAGALRT